VLTVPASAPEGGVPGRDRVKSLFDAHFLPDGTRFSDRLARSFGEQRAQDFTRCLRTALVERMHTPRLRNIELRGQGSAKDQLEPAGRSLQSGARHPKVHGSVFERRAPGHGRQDHLVFRTCSVVIGSLERICRAIAAECRCAV
jgi:hypothetical protein